MVATRQSPLMMDDFSDRSVLDLAHSIPDALDKLPSGIGNM